MGTGLLGGSRTSELPLNINRLQLIAPKLHNWMILRNHRYCKNSSKVSPISLMICFSNIGEISLPGWNGTVVPRPSGLRYCLWEPFCLMLEILAFQEWQRLLWVSGQGPFPWLGHHNILSPDKFTFHFWWSILQEHFYDFFQVVLQLVQSFTLRMSPREAWNETNIQTCFTAFFYDCRKCCHLTLHSKGENCS